MAPGACNDPEFFFFEDVNGGDELTLTITGPAGQFTHNVVFRDANTQAETPLPTPPGKRTLTSAKNKTHLVSVILFFAAACEVKVEATVGTQKYCGKVSRPASQTAKPVLMMRMVS